MLTDEQKEQLRNTLHDAADKNADLIIKTYDSLFSSGSYGLSEKQQGAVVNEVLECVSTAVVGSIQQMDEHLDVFMKDKQKLQSIIDRIKNIKDKEKEQ